ncbi:MAG TPA: carboxypeptidase regulatory-like domain-containing protein [Gemmatimonadales bacterium]
MKVVSLAALAGVLLAGPSPIAAPSRHAAAGTIRGTVTFTGTPPRMRPIDMAKEPICVAQHPTPVMTETVVTGPGNAVEWAVVYVSAGEPAASAPAQPARYDQRGCQYIPHVAVMQVGQRLDIYNDDSTSHNIHPMGTANPEWNRSQPQGTPPIQHTFAQPEMIPVKCNVHPWMHGYFAILNTAHYAVTDTTGHFTLAGLPPGHYTITAWHERMGTQTQDVTITGSESATANFVFRALPY